MLVNDPIDKLRRRGLGSHQPAVRASDILAETPAADARSKFRHWIDADGDCQDTCARLKAESRVASSGCDIRRGKWFSYFDHKTWTRATDVDIDHVVA